MSIREFITGLLVGFACGTAAGLLFAPREGIQTRRKLSDAAYFARERAGDFAMQVHGATSPLVGKIKQAI